MATVELKKFPSVFRESFDNENNQIVFKKKRYVIVESALEIPTFANWLENGNLE